MDYTCQKGMAVLVECEPEAQIGLRSAGLAAVQQYVRLTEIGLALWAYVRQPPHSRGRGQRVGDDCLALIVGQRRKAVDDVLGRGGQHIPISRTDAGASARRRARPAGCS